MRLVISALHTRVSPLVGLDAFGCEAGQVQLTLLINIRQQPPIDHLDST